MYYFELWLKLTDQTIENVNFETSIEIAKLSELVKGRNRLNDVEQKFLAALVGLEPNEISMTAEQIDQLYFKKWKRGEE